MGCILSADWEDWAIGRLGGWADWRIGRIDGGLVISDLKTVRSPRRMQIIDLDVADSHTPSLRRA